MLTEKQLCDFEYLATRIRADAVMMGHQVDNLRPAQGPTVHVSLKSVEVAALAGHKGAGVKVDVGGTVDELAVG